MINPTHFNIYEKKKQDDYVSRGWPAFKICQHKVYCIERGMNRKTRSERGYCTKGFSSS